MKNKIMTILFLVIVFGLGSLSILKEDIDVSMFERRKLARFPKEYSDNYTSKLDNYFVDQIAYRNEFISLNSNINRNLFGIKDDKNVYVINDNIYEINYPLNEENCINFCEKMNYITNKYFNNSNIYYTIIPDKSYFLDECKYLKMNYEKMYSALKSSMDGEYIDITNKLNIQDYYLTDIHWKQEKILDVATNLMMNMENKYISNEYIQEIYNNFYGASYSRGNNKIKPDILKYLTNEELEKAKVNHLEFGKKSIYDREKLYGVDAYDVFLSGPSSYIEIINEEAKNNKTLYVFRDSFASSIIPFFVPYYYKIVAIDLRYIDINLIEENLKNNNSDVLYLYSTLIINNSNILKVSGIK